jgi:hypothetical protein
MNLKQEIVKQRWWCRMYVSRDTVQEGLKNNVREIKNRLFVLVSG